MEATSNDPLPEIARLHAYSSPFNLGHKAAAEIWNGTVYIQEKIDGSQFSFGMRGGQLLCRSRKVEINQLDPGMFKEAVETTQRLHQAGLLSEGWTYRAEFLAKPKHNTLAYERVPAWNVILFDVDRGLQDYVLPMNPDPGSIATSALEHVATNLGLECVPTYFKSSPSYKPDIDGLREFLNKTSILGGPVEGVVIKNYDQYGPDKKVLMAKLVSAEFQETHRKDWAGRNPGDKDVIELLIEEYANPVRWKKAVQHLREIGAIQGAPQDIPIIMKEITTDVGMEAMDDIKNKLFAHFWPKIRRGLTRGFPEWFKTMLVEESLGPSEDSDGIHSA